MSVQAKGHWLDPKEYERIFSKVPRVTVECLILHDGVSSTQGNGIVLVRRSGAGWDGKWQMPGGPIMMQEHPHDAVCRVSELKTGVEKGGLHILGRQPLGVITYPSVSESGGIGWPVSLVYVCRWVQGALRHASGASDIKVTHHLDCEAMIPEHYHFLCHHGGNLYREFQLNVSY